MRVFLITLGFILAVIIIVAIDVSFLPALGGRFIAINLGLSIALYLMIIVNRSYSLLLFLFTTLLVGLTSSQLLFTPLILGLFSLLLVDRLFESFFTNRSYYTLLALGLVGWFCYYSLFTIITYLIQVINKESLLSAITFSWFANIILGSIFLLLILTASYLFTTFFSKKFKSYFIISE